LLKEREVVPVHTQLPFRRRLKRIYNVAAGITLGGLTISALYLLSLQTDYNLSSLTPVASFISNSVLNNTKVTSKYAADYVPYTADERIAAFAQLLPLPVAPDTVVEKVTPEPEVMQQELVSDSGSSLALVEGGKAVDNQEIAVEAEVAEVEKPAEPVLTVKEKTGRFYIITGGFSRLQNAETSRNAIRKEGHQEAKVLLPGRGSRLFRVAVADFATDAEAKAALKDYRKSFGETIWVLNN
jgi:hypothetical protein